MSSYDQNLLHEAPKATRAQLQEGYSVDLLEQPVRRTPSVRNPPAQVSQPSPVTVPLTPGIAETGSGEKLGSAAYIPAAPRSRTSFWRSRNGIIVAVIIALIVIGAVVGGAVGGTVGKSNKNVDKTGTKSVASSNFNPTPLPVSGSTPAGETTQGFVTAATTRTPTVSISSSPTSMQKGQNNNGIEVIAY